MSETTSLQSRLEAVQAELEEFGEKYDYKAVNDMPINSALSTCEAILKAEQKIARLREKFASKLSRYVLGIINPTLRDSGCRYTLQAYHSYHPMDSKEGHAIFSFYVFGPESVSRERIMFDDIGQETASRICTDINKHLQGGEVILAIRATGDHIRVKVDFNRLPIQYSTQEDSSSTRSTLSDWKGELEL
jgi:hypothetical protein